MIEYIKKDITTVETGVILHGCNCSGKAYGSGVAGAIRRKWPHAYESYIENGSGEQLLGTTEFLINSDNIGLIIANGYTQVNYGSDGKRYADLDAIRKCVLAATEYAQAFELSLYMPMIGCGLGGLSWEDEVKPIVKKISFMISDVNIYICDI